MTNTNNSFPIAYLPSHEDIELECKTKCSNNKTMKNEMPDDFQGHVAFEDTFHYRPKQEVSYINSHQDM